jgi:translation initiation factor 6 (eIF-6)
LTTLVRSPRRGLEKAVTAELEVIQARSTVAAAQEAARVDSIAAVAHRALLVTDQLSTIEAALIRRRPDEHTEVRLRFIADSAANAIGNVVLGLDGRL